MSSSLVFVDRLEDTEEYCLRNSTELIGDEVPLLFFSNLLSFGLQPFAMCSHTLKLPAPLFRSLKPPNFPHLLCTVRQSTIHSHSSVTLLKYSVRKLWQGWACAHDIKNHPYD